MDETVWHVIMAALANEYRNGHPLGGMIGRTASVFDALGFDKDMSMTEFRRRMDNDLR